MRTIRFVRIAFFAVLACLVIATAQARADVYMKNKTHTDAFTIMGQSQPAKDEIMVFWMGDNKARTDQEGANTSMIFQADKKMLYMVDHNKKQYSEMPLDFGKMFDGAADEAGGDEEDKAQAKAMAGMMKGLMGGMSAKVTTPARPRRSAIGTPAATPSRSTWAAWARPPATLGPPRTSKSTTPWLTRWPTA